MSADEEEPREGWMKPRSDGMGPGGSQSCSEGPSAGVHGLLLPGRGGSGGARALPGVRRSPG